LIDSSLLTFRNCQAGRFGDLATQWALSG